MLRRSRFVQDSVKELFHQPSLIVASIVRRAATRVPIGWIRIVIGTGRWRRISRRRRLTVVRHSTTAEVVRHSIIKAAETSTSPVFHCTDHFGEEFGLILDFDKQVVLRLG